MQLEVLKCQIRSRMEFPDLDLSSAIAGDDFELRRS